VITKSDDELLNELKKWRFLKGEEEKVSLYMILHNSTIEEIVKQRPKSFDDLNGVHGLGRHKIEKYGSDILKIINGDSFVPQLKEEDTNFLSDNSVFSINVGKPWNLTEDTGLIKAYMSGTSISELAKIHGRSSGGIRARLKLHKFGEDSRDIPEYYRSSSQSQLIEQQTAYPVQPVKQDFGNVLISFGKDKSEFFGFNNYISQSRILEFRNNYRGYYEEAKRLLADNEIPNSDIRQVNELILLYENLEKLSNEQNKKFIDYNLQVNKDYFDTILKDVDSNVMLDKEQRRAILSDEDYCLLVAGAGAGKTTTVAAKVKYLVEKKKVNPQDIIVISYTNKAIDELKERINVKLKIPANIITFHSFGFDILKKSGGNVPVVEYSAFKHVFECLERQIFHNKPLLRKVLLFMGFYLNIPEDALNFENLNAYFNYKASNFFETIKSNAGEYIKTVSDKRTEQRRTITGEYVRSNQEVQIANFLYMNGIEYKYEERYPHQHENSKKVYTPDFTIEQAGKIYYLEHFGISQNYMNNLYSSTELERYKNSILYKRRLHKDKNTTLIETYSSYNDRRELTEHLKEELERFGIVLHPRKDEEVYRKLVDTSKDKYVYRFGDLILKFIERYKSCGYDEGGFKILKQKQDNVRTNLFLDIVEEVYIYYQDQLKNKNSVDFADMINNAEKLMKAAESNKIFLPYKYIIIDEFQDIARQRFNLTKTLANITGAKIVAVGDDWQSIFAFAGSDITLFQRFLELMGHGIEMQITHTYRNSQELIDIAGGFIQKNPTQIKKRLLSPKSIRDPVAIVEYDDSSQVAKNWAKAIDDCIDGIVKEYGDKKDILLISRYNTEKDRLCKSGLFIEGRGDSLVSKRNPKVKISYLTAHSSKGLGFDNVLIINMKEATYGFPSQLDDDPILKLVTTQDLSIPYAEERRLFYVALTRTKNKVFMVTPQKSPSRFVLELIQDYKIRHSEKLSFEIKERNKISCPMCQASLRYQMNSNYGLQLYMCTNDPEVCDFMTNNKNILADIFKCTKCKDGYMIVRASRKNNDYFYGCSDYPNCQASLSISDEVKNRG